MKTWLFAVIVTSAVAPSSALLTTAHLRAADELDRRRGAVGDVLVDTPTDHHGLTRNVLTVATVIGTQYDVQETSKVLTAAVLLEAGDVRRVARLEGLALGSPRFKRLERFVAAGKLSTLGTSNGGVVLGEELARGLELEPGGTVGILSLSPGPKSLGFRRRTMKVAASIDTGLHGLDTAVALTDIATARSLIGPGDKVSGVLAWLGTPLDAEELRSRLSKVVSDDRRVRHHNDRDRPRHDALAFVAMAQSTLLLVVLVTFLSLSLAGVERGRPYGAVLGQVAPIAGLAIATSVLAGMCTAALVVGPRLTWHYLGVVEVDLCRLVIAAIFGVLASPLLVGRVRKIWAFVALAAVIALAMNEPLSSTTVGSGARRMATRLSNAAQSIERIASSGPLPGAIILGAEVVPVELVGLDPTDTAARSLLEELCHGDVPRLRNPGDKRPPARPPVREGIDDLLDQLAKEGRPAPVPTERRDVAEEERNASDPPPIVLGHTVARLLGAHVGDRVRVVAAPPGLSPEGDDDPPWPRAFEVASIATLGLGAVDERLALADTWQVEALGGTDGESRGGLAPEEDVAQAASRPFVDRAQRSALAAALQISVIAFLLGGVAVTIGRKRWSLLVGFVAIGALGGMFMGFNESTYGMVTIGDPSWYVALPMGRLVAGDILSLWSFLPAIVGFLAAALGCALSGRSAAAKS